MLTRSKAFVTSGKRTILAKDESGQKPSKNPNSLKLITNPVLAEESKFVTQTYIIADRLMQQVDLTALAKEYDHEKSNPTSSSQNTTPLSQVTSILTGENLEIGKCFLQQLINKSNENDIPLKEGDYDAISRIEEFILQLAESADNSISVWLSEIALDSTQPLALREYAVQLFISGKLSIDTDDIAGALNAMLNDETISLETLYSLIDKMVLLDSNGDDIVQLKMFIADAAANNAQISEGLYGIARDDEEQLELSQCAAELLTYSLNIMALRRTNSPSKNSLRTLLTYKDILPTVIYTLLERLNHLSNEEIGILTDTLVNLAANNDSIFTNLTRCHTGLCETEPEMAEKLNEILNRAHITKTKANSELIKFFNGAAAAKKRRASSSVTLSTIAEETEEDFHTQNRLTF